MPRPCQYCDSLGHTAFICPAKPRQTLVSKLHCTRCDSTNHVRGNCPERTTDKVNPATGRYPAIKRLRTAGKFTILWERTRREWIKANPPDHSGFYYCYLHLAPDCLNAMTTDQMTLDHIKSRSRYPELRFEHSNLKPCCMPCNVLKGSRDIEEIKG